MGVWNLYHSHNDPSNIAIFESTIKTFEPTIKTFELNEECCSNEEHSPFVKHIIPVIVTSIEHHYYYHYYVYQPVITKEIRQYHHRIDRSLKCPINYNYEQDPKRF